MRDSQKLEEIARFMRTAWDTPPVDFKLRDKIVARWPGTTEEDIRQAGILAMRIHGGRG